MIYFLDMHFDFDMYLEFEFFYFFFFTFLVIYFLMARPLLLHPVVNISESLFSFSLTFFSKLAYVAQKNRFMTVPIFEVLQYLNADYCSRDVLICHCPSSIPHSVSQNGRAS